MLNKGLTGTIAFLMTLLLAGGCGDGATGPNPLPLPDPGNFVSVVTNPLFPLTPGTTYHYATADGTETGTVGVLIERRTILGIETTIVHDQVFTAGALSEETFDWYAQDNEGNVWYLGEDSREIENGQVVGTAGSWEAGVNGAQPGIIMWADPAAHVGEEYRQEFARGVAEDVAKVVAVDQSVSVPYGSFSGCTQTEDRNPLDPGPVENKYYCPQTGLTLEVSVQNPSDRNELIDVTGP